MEMAYPFRGACTPLVSARPAPRGRSRVRPRGSGSSAWGSGLDTYGFEDEELRRAVDRLVGDRPTSALGDAVRAADGRLEVGSPRWPDSRHDPLLRTRRTPSLAGSHRIWLPRLRGTMLSRDSGSSRVLNASDYVFRRSRNSATCAIAVFVRVVTQRTY